MNKDQAYFFLLNIGHFLDHLFMLVFATVAALTLYHEWNIGYAELLAYATPGFFAFGLFSLPAGWLADRWSRDGMMVVFFVGIGLASIATSFAETPLQMGIGLFIIGVFAAIYHPVGLAIVTMKWRNTGIRIAANGVWGNLGVAAAALITGFFIEHLGWRLAFVVPGIFSILIGIWYFILRRESIVTPSVSDQKRDNSSNTETAPQLKRLLVRISIIVFLTTAVSSVIFQSTTFALPKIFDERLQSVAQALSNWFEGTGQGPADNTASAVGFLAFAVFAIASLAQLVVGSSLDRFGPRNVFAVVATIQLVFFSLMPGTTEGTALIVALGFMLGAFGQIPINDFMIGKVASGSLRASIYGVRYVVAFTALALSLPLIAYVYANWGFDRLFQILAAASLLILIAVLALPGKFPSPRNFDPPVPEQP